LVRRLPRVAVRAVALSQLRHVLDRGRAAGAQPMNLFVDITSNRLADEVDISKKKRLDSPCRWW
jgi:hypothetical protein